MNQTETGGNSEIKLVLFDLDGTFADTAPDLAFALNRTLVSHGRCALPLGIIRPKVSQGGVAMIRLGFDISPDHPEFDQLRREFLDVYVHNLSRGTTLFPGIRQLLSSLTGLGVSWGIVTNKPAWLTDPLMEELQMSDDAVCIVSGDSTEFRKPHPGPIIHACRLAGIAPKQTLYVGDAERDITAGNLAGTSTLVALFGYIDQQEDPCSWQADGFINHPLQIVDWLKCRLG